MTNREAIREIRKKGTLYVEALVRNGVRYVEAVKAGLVWQIEQDIEREGPDAHCAWEITRVDGGIYADASQEER